VAPDTYDPDPSNEAPDPGPVDAPTLKERDYIIPAQDSKGHHTRLYCRAIPSVGRMVADVHASRKYPFRTVGDLIRFCIVTKVKELASGAGIQSVIAQADAIIAYLQDEEYQLQFLEMFTHLQRVTNTYIEMGAPGEARRVAAHTRAFIEAMPDADVYWKDKYREELLRRYSNLLDAPGEAKGVWDVDAPAPEITPDTEPVHATR
jgi:hypothetical protein